MAALVATLAVVFSRSRSTSVLDRDVSLAQPAEGNVDVPGGQQGSNLVSFSSNQQSTIQNAVFCPRGAADAKTNETVPLPVSPETPRQETQVSSLFRAASNVTSQEIMEASAKFKEDPHGFNRGAAARILMGRIRPGLTAEQVQEILGPPTKKEGSSWIYATSYSSFLRIGIGPDGKVLAVTSVGLH